MKRLFALISAMVLLAGCGGVQDQGDPTATSGPPASSRPPAPSVAVESSGVWKVTMQTLDMENPEDTRYIEQVQAKEDNRFVSVKGQIDAWETYFARKEKEKEDALWTYVWADEKKETLTEQYRPWHGSIEFVVRYIKLREREPMVDYERREFLLRDKSTGKTKLLISANLSDTYATANYYEYDVLRIFDDTHFLYEEYYTDFDGAFRWNCYLYDAKTKKSTLIYTTDGNPIALDDMVYLCVFKDYDAGKAYLRLNDVPKMIAGKDNAVRDIARWRIFDPPDKPTENDMYLSLQLNYVSKDKRYVYMTLSKDYNGRDDLRAVYDIETGEEMARFDLDMSNLSKSMLLDNKTELMIDKRIHGDHITWKERLDAGEQYRLVRYD